MNKEEFLRIIRVLKEGNIFHRISSYRKDVLCIEAIVPGEHWEISFFNDNSVELEVFESDGEIYNLEKTKELFNKYSGKTYRSIKQG